MTTGVLLIFAAGVGSLIVGVGLAFLAESSGLPLAILGSLAMAIAIAAAVSNELAWQHEDRQRLVHQCQQRGGKYYDCMVAVLAAQRGGDDHVLASSSVDVVSR
jgi:hypothetical protein